MLCRGLEKKGLVRALHGRGMASVNQIRSHCVNQMGKTYSKPLAARRGRETAWALYVMCESALSVLFADDAVKRKSANQGYAFKAPSFTFQRETLSCSTRLGQKRNKHGIYLYFIVDWHLGTRSPSCQPPHYGSFGGGIEDQLTSTAEK